MLLSGAAALFLWQPFEGNFLASQIVNTPEVTYVSLKVAVPTKFARLVPIDTPGPTNTAIPSSTAIPSLTSPPTPTGTKRPTKPPTIAFKRTAAATVTPSHLLVQSPRSNGACATIDGVNYGSLSVNSAPSDRPAEQDADLNLSLRGYTRFSSFLGLVDVYGDTENVAPQLAGLFSDGRTPLFVNTYQVFDWNWDTNRRGGAIGYPEVTLAGLGVTPGERILVPDAGNNIGGGAEVLVLYAATNRITLKYTREDNVRQGYTLHLENVCVEPRLLALYQELNLAGRGSLPSLFPGQAVGLAIGGEIGVAIRDSGTFMDPRSRKDWWRGH